MNRRQLLATPLLPLLSASLASANSSPRGGLGFTVEEWLNMYGDPDDYATLHLRDIGSTYTGTYILNGYKLTTHAPLNDSDALIRMLGVAPTKSLHIEGLSRLAELYLPSDAIRMSDGKEGTSGDSFFVDYASRSLKKQLRFEEGPNADGTLRIIYAKKSKNSKDFYYATLGLGTYWFARLDDRYS